MDHHGEIATFQGELRVGGPYSPTRPLRSIARDFVLDNLSPAIIAGNVVHAGYKKPDLINLFQKLEGIKSYEVGLFTINDVPTFRTLKEQYELLQKKCRVIVIGGQLPSRTPEKFQRNFPDANIFIGECEGSMKQVLDLSFSGKKGELWTSPPTDIFNNYVLPIRYGKRRFIWPVEFGRGCTNRCPFCSLPTCMRQVRQRDPQQIKEEVERFKTLTIVDPNLAGYSHEFLYEIFLFMLKHKKKWVGEGIIKQILAMPKELQDLIFRSCIGFVGGIEDPFLRVLHQNKFDGRLLPNTGGYLPIYSFIIGHPQQRLEDFKRIQKMIHEKNLTPILHIYSPTCGTPDYQKALRDDALSTENLEAFDRRQVVVKGNVSPEGIKEAFQIARTSINLVGTFKELFRILRDSDHIALTYYRLGLLFRVRVMNIARGMMGRVKKG